MADGKNNLRATNPPLVTDDSSAGYSQGSYWEYNGIFYICRSAAVGAAVWVQIMPPHAWPSGTYAYPDNFVDFADVTPGTTNDFIAYFPFFVTRPVAGAGLYLRTVGSAGAAAAFAIYNNDPATGKPSTRISSFGTTALDAAAGFRASGSSNLDLFGLYWVSVSVKLAGLTTAPTFVRMTKANGKHVHRNDGNDVNTLVPNQCFNSQDTYTASPPNTAGTTIAGSVPVPMPVLKAA